MYRDMIDPSTVTIENSFPDVMLWPITVGLSNVALQPGTGVWPTMIGAERWPDYTPPDWTGPIFSTIWAGFKVNGRWVLSGFHQFYRDRTHTGAHPLEIAPDKNINHWQANWAYPGHGWNQLQQVVPTQGVEMAVMMSAGDARFGQHITVKERTQLVTVPLLPSGSWGFADDGVGTTPPPVTTPPPTTTPPTDAVMDLLTQILTKLDTLQSSQRAQEQYEDILHNVKNNGAGIGKIQDQLNALGISKLLGKLRP